MGLTKLPAQQGPLEVPAGRLNFKKQRPWCYTKTGDEKQPLKTFEKTLYNMIIDFLKNSSAMCSFKKKWWVIK